jgi:hypothetical protein
MKLEDFFILIQDKLKVLPEINWVDLNFGQLESETRPAVQFPCALISIDLPRTEDLGQNIQRCYATIGIRLGFDFKGSAAAKSPEPIRAKALDYYRITREVYTALQGYSQSGLSRLKRSSQVEMARPDQIKIVDLTFTCEFHDHTAVVSP